MSHLSVPPRWAYTENVVVTLVEIAAAETRWTYLVARDTLAPGAFVLTMDDGGNVLVNGVLVTLADHELMTLCALIDDAYQGCPNLGAEIGRPHPVQR